MAVLSGELVIGLRTNARIRTFTSIQMVAGTLRVGSGAVMQFTGHPWSAVEWTIVSGNASLEVERPYTNELGVAQAIMRCNGAGPVVVRVRYGA